MVPNTVQKGGQVARQFTDLVVRQRLRSALRRSPRCGYAAASPTSRSSAQRRPARRKQPTTIPTPALLPAANDVEHQLIQPPGWRHDAWHADAHHQGGNQSSRPTRNQAMKCGRHTNHDDVSFRWANTFGDEWPAAPSPTICGPRFSMIGIPDTYLPAFFDRATPVLASRTHPDDRSARRRHRKTTSTSRRGTFADPAR